MDADGDLSDWSLIDEVKVETPVVGENVNGSPNSGVVDAEQAQECTEIIKESRKNLEDNESFEGSNEDNDDDDDIDDGDGDGDDDDDDDDVNVDNDDDDDGVSVISEDEQEEHENDDYYEESCNNSFRENIKKEDKSPRALNLPIRSSRSSLIARPVHKTYILNDKNEDRSSLPRWMRGQPESQNNQSRKNKGIKKVSICENIRELKTVKLNIYEYSAVVGLALGALSILLIFLMGPPVKQPSVAMQYQLEIANLTKELNKLKTELDLSELKLSICMSNYKKLDDTRGKFDLIAMNMKRFMQNFTEVADKIINLEKLHFENYNNQSRHNGENIRTKDQHHKRSDKKSSNNYGKNEDDDSSSTHSNSMWMFLRARARSLMRKASEKLKPYKDKVFC